MAGTERWFRFLHRWRYVLGLSWFVFLASLAGFLWFYPRAVRADVDLGVTIAARTLAYRSTFRELERAEEDRRAGQVDRAEHRLEVFLAEHPDVQPAQLETHAVVDATLELADLAVQRGSLGRAEDLLADLTERFPLDWYPWFRLGKLRASRGDLTGAADSLLEAFHRTGNHATVAEETIDVLADLVRSKEVLEVADEFERSRSRAGPQVDAKIGLPRSAAQRRALSFVGVPVEHGAYQRTVRRFGLPRGDDATVDLPPEMFEGFEGAEVYLQLRFQNVYEGLALRGTEVLGADGSVLEGSLVELEPQDVAELHRAHSGGDWYLEFRRRLPRELPGGLRVRYRCPEQTLSREIQNRIESARRNVSARGGP